MAGTSAVSGREQLLAAVVDHLAEHSVDGQSLRSIAAAVGTSHRMLIYHFGSREGLLAAVVGEVERLEREAFAVVEADDTATPREVAERFWEHVVGQAMRYGPLFFELSAHAMQGRAHAQALAAGLVEPWLDILTGAIVAAGVDPARARTQARLGLATVRGLLFDLLVTGDRAGVDDACRLLLDLVDEPARPDVPVPEG